LQQFASLSTDYDPVEWHHDTPVPQGLLQAEEEYHADSVRPEIGTGKGSRILVTGGAGAIGRLLV
jgi:NADPH:quinone reductase-like Zn-dependent oxidoreductase